MKEKGCVATHNQVVPGSSPGGTTQSLTFNCQAFLFTKIPRLNVDLLVIVSFEKIILTNRQEVMKNP